MGQQHAPRLQMSTGELAQAHLGRRRRGIVKQTWAWPHPILPILAATLASVHLHEHSTGAVGCDVAANHFVIVKNNNSDNLTHRVLVVLAADGAQTLDRDNPPGVRPVLAPTRSCGRLSTSKFVSGVACGKDSKSLSTQVLERVR